MRLCFDATKFGYGLQESVQLAMDNKLTACEFSFDSFDIADEAARALSEDESVYLKTVDEFSRANDIEIACLRLKSVLQVSNPDSLRQFEAMIDKLSKVARALSCKRILFYLSAESNPDWLQQVETALNPLVASLREQGLTLVLSLSTPAQFLGKSLRTWRPIEPQEWRELIAGVPGLGLSVAVADCAWQGIDYLRVISGLAAAIEHVEAQDVYVNRQIISENGIFGPLWWSYKTVGKGQVDWAQFVEALKLYEYAGSLSIQFKDEFASESETGLWEAMESSIKLLTPLLKY